jgi:hypothetical protein
MVAMAGSGKVAGVRKVFKSSVPGFPTAANPNDRRRQNSSLLPSRKFSSLQVSYNARDQVNFVDVDDGSDVLKRQC